LWLLSHLPNFSTVPSPLRLSSGRASGAWFQRPTLSPAQRCFAWPPLSPSWLWSPSPLGFPYAANRDIVTLPLLHPLMNLLHCSVVPPPNPPSRTSCCHWINRFTLCLVVYGPKYLWWVFFSIVFPPTSFAEIVLFLSPSAFVVQCPRYQRNVVISFKNNLFPPPQLY